MTTVPGRFVLLLRGINVGGHKKVAMADLRALLTGLGFDEVATLLQSGNAVFTAPSGSPAALEVLLEGAVRDRFGMEVRCLVRTDGELRAVIEAHPLAEVASDGSRMLVLFCSADPDPALLASYDPRDLAPGEVFLGDRVIYQWCPQGILQAPAVGPFVEKRLKVAVTARNWNTVTRLAALAAQAQR